MQDIAHDRQQAHAYLDMLPPDKLNAVRILLEVMVEPLARSLASVPVEDEELSPETAEALERATASLVAAKAFRTTRSCASSASDTERVGTYRSHLVA